MRKILFFDILDVILPGSEADRFGVFGNVRSVLAVDPFLQGLGVISGGIRVVENQIQELGQGWIQGLSPQKRTSHFVPKSAFLSSPVPFCPLFRHWSRVCISLMRFR